MHLFISLTHTSLVSSKAIALQQSVANVSGEKSTQMPYVFTVAGVCAVGYIISGFVQNVFVVLGASVVMMIAVLFAIKMVSDSRMKSLNTEKK